MDKKWIQYLGTAEVAVRPLGELFASLPTQPERIDLLNVDPESMDLEVLLSNDWSKYQPRVIVVESGNFDPARPFEDPVLICW